MSESERQVADTTGRFLQIIKDGSKIESPQWTNGRVLLSNRRLILVGRSGKRAIPLTAVEGVNVQSEATGAVAGVSTYTSLKQGKNVVLVSTRKHRTFEIQLCSALLEDEHLLVQHPAVEGGVVRETPWETARIRFDHEDETVNVGTQEGSFIGIELEDVGQVDVSSRTIKEDPKQIVAVEHSEDGTSVETHLAGSARGGSLIKVVFDRGFEQNSSEIDLDGEKKQVLMALYSGVSPFEIPEFTDIGVESVEDIYEELIDLEVLSEVRIRREVELTPRGRNLASEAISDE